MTASLCSHPDPFNTAPLTRRSDYAAQRALLGEDAYLLDMQDDMISPLSTPSPVADCLSPLSVASHSQSPFAAAHDENPFLDPSWSHSEPSEDTLSRSHITTRSQSPQSLKSRRNPIRTMTPQQSQLATIQETRSVIAPAVKRRVASTSSPSPRPSPKSSPTRILYALPPVSPYVPSTSHAAAAASASTSTSGSSGSSHPPSPVVALRRRPSPFPQGPVPAPPARRIRYEPRPHIVDLAVEQFNLDTPTISSSSSSSVPPLQQERERQWKMWDAERARSMEMTREAAKNNRVQTPRLHKPAPASVAVHVASSSAAPVVSEEKPRVKKAKRSWWCFGGNNAAADSDVESPEEKRPQQQQQQQQPASRPVSRLSDASSIAASDSEDEDVEQDWDEARSVVSDMFTFSACSKDRRRRPRATLKKRSTA